MKNFISYNTSNIQIGKQLAGQLSTSGQVNFWAESKLPGTEAGESIFKWIDTTDIVVVLITENTDL